MGLRSLVIVLSAVWLFGTSPVAEAVMLHTFDCNNCHKAGTSYTTLDGNNVCLSCHNKPTTGVHFNNDLLTDPDRKSDAGFVIGDATNALGSYPAGVTEGKQNSHYWAAQKDVNAAAGAEAPVAIQFYSRNGTSTGKVTCSRCHNPHGDSTQPQLLKLATAEAVCKDCHRSWYAGAGNLGHLTHPLPSLTDGTYASFVADGTGRFRDIPAFDPAVSSSVAILPDGTMGCTSCHGAHFTDSDGTTPDGPLAIQGNGDGRMLRGNGALIIDADPALQAQKRSNLCQSCHTYQLHGSVNPIGCLDCHSGHSYNGGNPNFFVLRSEATNIPMPKAGGAIQSISGLVYNSATFNWLDVGGNGYCQNCHTIPVDGTGKHNGLDAGSMTDCVGCHGHGNSEVSFGGSCNSCHGYPPSTDTASGTTGYAVDPNAGAGFLNGYKFLDDGSTLRAVYKNEANTPHLAHAGVGAGEYGIACEECHVATFPVDLGTHPNQNFQDVTFDVFAATGMTGTAYNTANPGTCSNIYCHSNGGARAAAPVAATIPGWDNGSTTGAITTCDACHGNSAGTMVSKSNSGGHQPHLGAGAILGKTYGCAVCHDQTAIDKDNLSATAIGGTHVDGQKDVLVTVDLLGVTNLGLTAVVGTDGTCQSIYCHSDGKGNYITPDWDNAPSVACNTCHDNTGASLSGAHQRHILDADGPGLTCDACHPAGANTGAHGEHIDGNLDKPADAVCAGCHGATVGVTTGNDREPQWLLGSSVDCETCHAGVQAVINGRTAPAKDVFGTSGHGKTGVTKVCLDCHDGAGSGHLDATAGDNRLLTLGGGYSAATPEGFCAACHTGTTETNHYGNGGSGSSLDGNHCNSCHDPHGAGLDAMILSNIGGRPVVGFADKSVRENYYVVTPSAAGYGICQVCHDPNDPSAAAGDIKYFNTTTSTPGHYAGVCISCHKHDSTTAFTPSGCNGCHGDSVTEQYWPYGSGGTIPTANDDKGRHDAHVLLIGQSLGYGSYAPTMYSDAQQKAICAYCHDNPGSDGDHGNVLSLPADTAFHPLWNVSAVAVGTYDTTGDVQGTCSNIACHNSKATGSSTNAGNITTFGWKDAGTATCVMCHAVVTDGAVANSTGGTHVAHTGAQATYGVTIACATCHDGATVWNTTKPAVGHLNGTLNVSGTVTLTYASGSCGTNACHNDGTGAGAPKRSIAGGDVSDYAWGTSEASACGICHAATPATGKHGEHVGSTTYVAGSCNDCHDTNTGNALAAAAEATHLNAVVNTANKISVYSGTPAFTCTNACHTANTANDWSATGSLACTDCHGSGIVTTPALDRGWPPTTVRTAAHTAHTDNSGYVTVNCVDCHNNNVGAHSTLDGSVTSPTLGAKITAYNTVAGTCTNTCHADSGADFHDSTPAPGCSDCHGGTYIGGGTNMPTSGLHTGTLTVSGNTHDVLFQATNGEAVPSATCITCHTTTPSSAHVDGSFDASIGADAGAGQKINFVAAVNFGDAVTPTCGPNGALASCHDDGGAWGRKWSTTARNSNGTECANCHGDFTNSWVAGMAQRHSADPELTANHAVCATCHTYIAGDTTYYDPSTQHRDQIIQLNNGMSFSDDGATVSCSGCHTTPLGLADGQHSFQDTWAGDAVADGGLDRWGRVLQAGPAADCASCHTSSGMTHGGTTESAALHTRHLASPYITGCTDCHTHDTGSGVDHLNDSVNFGGQMTGTANYAKTVDFGGTCAGTNGCHDSSSGNWKTETLTGTCADCHASAGTLGVAAGGVYPPTSGEHAPHLGNTVKITGCTDCHTHGGAMGGDHVNTTVETGASITGYTGGDCTTLCHTSANGDWATAGSLTCANCHNAAGNTLGAPISATLNTNQGPTGDKHDAHTGADTDYVADCATCHTHNGELGSVALGGLHVDGLQKTLVVTITVNADKSCTNSCHLAASLDEWNTGSLGCTDCHTQTTKTLGAVGTALMSGTLAPDTGRHTAHMNNTTYLGAGCTECHSHNGTLGTVGHVNGPNKGVIEVSNKITVTPIPADDTCTNNCHAVVDGRDWTVGAQVNGTALACADCHASAGTLGQGGWPAGSNAHTPHMASNALPNAAQSDCYACHDGTIDNTGALKAAGTHLNLTSGDLAFNGSFNYEAGTAGRAAGAAATTTCSAVLCHNGVTTPTWGAVTISCGQCHNTAGTGPLPSGSIGGSHAAHANNDGVYTDCENCHTGAATYTATGGTNHQNLTVDLNRSYTDLDGGAGIVFAAPGTDNGTCATVDCHFNNTTPAWGAVGSTTCTTCHNNGTNDGSLANSVPTATAGIHGRHVTDAAAAYVDDCNACHGANASTGGQTGHANLATTYGNSLGGYAAGSCSANLCHDDAAGNLWSNGATLTCNDCHNATSKSLYVSGALTAATPPATGKHALHDANSLAVLSVGCTACHPHSGSFAAATHADGGSTGLASNVDLSGSVTVPGETQTGWTNTCTNACHSATAGDEWTTGILECSDCHSGAYVGGGYSGTGQHDVHNLTTPAAYTTAAARTANAGAYDFNCANCHGSTAANHMNNELNVAAGVNYSLGNCSSNACHQNGQGAPAAVVANWTSGWVSDPTVADACDNCHGNTPTTGAHTVHAVGIHAEDIYSGTTGLLSHNAIASLAHGVGTTSTVISCNTCHNNTVTSWYNANNTACVSCHDTSNTSLGDNPLVIATYDNHVNSIKDVAFQNIAVKSKAQLRDDITAAAEISNNWTRSSAYKGAGDFDLAKSNLSADSYVDVTCTNACHNGIPATWQAPTNNCMTCHTQLPQ